MIKLLTTAALLTMSITMTAANETIVLRIKGMRCEECAHKVTTVLRQLEGIEGVNFDLEKRTATVEFDASKTCTDSIKGRLAATGRYKSSPYIPADVINRGMGLQMSDMHCQKMPTALSAGFPLSTVSTAWPLIWISITSSCAMMLTRPARPRYAKPSTNWVSPL